jgi:hypothetical protein
VGILPRHRPRARIDWPGLRTLAILAGILFIIRGVFEIALGWELHRIHRA